MNILSSLRYLVALNEHKHFGRAALACHITQPALSNALRALEAEFDVVIVHRGRTFAGLTPEGERVLSSAQRMLHEHQLLQQSLKSTADRPAGEISIGAVPTAVPIAARFAAMLQARHPCNLMVRPFGGCQGSCRIKVLSWPQRSSSPTSALSRPKWAAVPADQTPYPLG